jgi:hypothetical protein
MFFHALALTLAQLSLPSDDVVRVNEVPIQRVELERYRSWYQRGDAWALRGGPRHPLTPGMLRLLAESAIDEVLLAQEARRRGLGVTPDEVDEGVKAVRLQHDAPGAFEAMLERNGFTADSHRDAVRRYFDAERLRMKLALEPVTVTDAEVRAEYERRSGPVCRRLFQLVIPVSSTATEKDLTHATWLAGHSGLRPGGGRAKPGPGAHPPTSA